MNLNLNYHVQNERLHFMAITESKERKIKHQLEESKKHRKIKR
jgi:hypothetical protein